MEVWPVATSCKMKSAPSARREPYTTRDPSSLTAQFISIVREVVRRFGSLVTLASSAFSGRYQISEFSCRLEKIRRPPATAGWPSVEAPEEVSRSADPVTWNVVGSSARRQRLRLSPVCAERMTRLPAHAPISKLSSLLPASIFVIPVLIGSPPWAGTTYASKVFLSLAPTKNRCLLSAAH